MDRDGEQKKDVDPLSNIRDLFQSFGLRCSSALDDQFDRILLAWNFRVLPAISGVLYLILLAIQN
jgi:hypothetical protein